MKWRKDGTCEKIHAALREQVRVGAGRPAHPPAPPSWTARASKPSTGAAASAAMARARKISGPKRHLLVDTLGLVWMVVVPSADVQDRDGARLVLERLLERMVEGLTGLARILSDAIYAGELVGWVKEKLNVVLEIVRLFDAALLDGTVVALIAGLIHPLTQ